MTDPRTKVRSLLLVVVMIVGTVPAMGAAPAAASTGNAPDSFHVQQAGQCYEVGSLGDGSQSVEEFYDYRNNETDPQSFHYSSYGTTHLQDNQQSKLAVYDGSGGYSLVVLHDKHAIDGSDGSNASTVTFGLSGVGDASWAVRDDTYGDDTQDDNWDTAGNTHEIDWKWASNRSDGGALRGIVGESITIDPGFNDDAEAWGSWDYSGDDQNRTDDWRVIDGSNDYYLEQSLDLDEELTLEAGACPDATGPSADLTASTSAAETGESVTLDASGSTDGDDDIERYHWDFDGDGEIDERTTDATVEHAYDESGDHEATVVVTDETHKQDTASATVEVTDPDSGGGDDGSGDDGGDGDDGDSGGGDGGEPPTAAISAVDEAPLSETLWLDARDSTDDENVTAYKYYVDGELLWQDKGPTPDRTSLQPWEHLNGTGTYEMSVKVWDAAGQTDTASTTVKVVQEDEEKPEADIEMDGAATVGETVTFRAVNITEDEETLTHVCWELDGTSTVEAHNWTTTFEESGDKEITLVLNDRAGNYNEVTKTVHVAADDGNGGDGDDGGNGDEGGLDDGDDDDTRTGGMPGAQPNDSDDEQALTDRPENVTANLTDGDARFGGVVVVPNASADDVDVTVHATAPAGLPAPTPDDDGFEAVSFLTASGADHATVTVSADRLDALGAAPEDVSLFRYENDSWTAVETSVANATDDAYEFRANVTDGSYAVGVERAAIGVDDMTVRDGTVAPGEAATVAVTVANDGLAEGSQQVSLSVDGEVVDTRNVSLSPGEWSTLRFSPTFAGDGTYEVSAGDATGEVVGEAADATSTTTTVETTESGDEATGSDDSTTSGGESAGVPGFGVGIALVALLAGTLLALRRR